MSALALYHGLAVEIRKLRRSRRFDRIKAAKPLKSEVGEYWRGGLDALFEYLGERDRWEIIQRHCQSSIVEISQSVRKSLSDADRQMLVDLLSGFGYFNDSSARAEAIVRACYFDTYEEAAGFALKQLGYTPDFELRNEGIRDALLERKEQGVLATRSHIDAAMNTIVEKFYEQGRNPYDRAMLDELKSTLGYKTDYEAARFALTETAIVSERAGAETYRRNGVQRKKWNINGVNTRPSHAELDQVELDIDDTFNVGGYAADHPCDPSLPAEELVNCHCWLEPVVDDNYQIDPDKVWEGQ